MYKSILVPLDGSFRAEKALDEAATLVQRGVGVLTVIRVVPTIEEMYETAQPNPLDTAEQTQDSLARAAYDEHYANARQYLRLITHSVEDCGFRVESRVAEGDPAAAIIEAAEDVEADVVVLTPRGKSACSTPHTDGVFGSVSDEVLRRAHLPVLVVKE